MSPEPDHRAMNDLRQLPRRNLVPLAEGGMAAVMRQHDQPAIVAIGIHRGLEPRRSALAEACTAGLKCSDVRMNLLFWITGTLPQSNFVEW